MFTNIKEIKNIFTKWWSPEKFRQHPIRAEILIVEDDKEQAELLQQLFTLQDTKADVVYNIQDALTKLDEITYHIVIIDLKLSGTHYDGLVLLKKIKESKRMTHPVVCSGYYTAEIFNYGYVGILPKPFSFHSIREILVKHRLHRSD